MNGFRQVRLRHGMNGAGVGYAGIEGVWWLPAVAPFVLPAQIERDLAHIGRALFALFDAVTDLFGTSEGAACGLNELLEYKVPPTILRMTNAARVLSVRPDFQLRPLDASTESGLQLVATELEICPSAHGFAHAMQVGYGLPTNLVESFARFLDGRTLLFVCTTEWSEFLFEQLAFCRALAELGAHGRVLFDAPITTLAERVRRGELWRLPMFGIQNRPPVWHTDILDRIRSHQFESFVWPDDARWPEKVGDAVVFRFGYFDCFPHDKLEQMRRWEAQGATFLNPPSFIFDSKVIMAALHLPRVRKQITPSDLTTLDQCIPDTRVLRPDLLSQLQRDQAGWVLKFAGYDHGNQAWGGRSLQIGAQHTAESWSAILQRYLALPFPVVAQRAAPSARTDIAYLDANDDTQWLRRGNTRLRSFMLREADRVTACGAHLTVSGGTMQVSESTDAVQAPVAFLD